MLPLRVCYFIQECIFDEKCDEAASPLKDLTDTLLSVFNVSLVAKPISSHYPTNEGNATDVCLLSLARNESDVILLPYTMPLIMSNIRTGPVVFSDKIAIASTYKFENDNSNPQILDTFNAFGVDTVTLILHFFVILAVLICLTYIFERKSPCRRVRMNGRRFNFRFVPWFIFRFFVKQYPSFPGNMTASKIILTCCLLLFSFFVTFFYSSMIKTDKVTVKVPRVITSYQDILDDPEIVPYIGDIFDEHISFKKAPEGSLRKKVWGRIMNMEVNKLLHQNGCIRDDGADCPYFHDRNPFMRTKAVIISYASMNTAAKYSAAVYLKSVKIRRGLYVSDPTENEKLSASLINRITSEALSQKYEIRMRRFFEGHFYEKFLHSFGLYKARLLALLTQLGTNISDTDEYVGNKVVLPEPILMKLNAAYFMPLFILYFVFCFIQFIIFLIGRWVSGRGSNRTDVVSNR